MDRTSQKLALQWRHNGRNGVSNHQSYDCLLNRLLRRGSKITYASLAFVRGIHRWPVNSPQTGPVTRKMSPFDDVIMVKELAKTAKDISYCRHAEMCPVSRTHLTNNNRPVAEISGWRVRHCLLPPMVKTLQSLEKLLILTNELGYLSFYNVLSNKYISIECWITDIIWTDDGIVDKHIYAGWDTRSLNSLAPGRFEWNFSKVNFKLIW